MDIILRLFPINAQGICEELHVPLPPIAIDACQATRAMYDADGYAPPWGGYLAMLDEVCVGTCAFRTSPKLGAVEIAYFTFPEFEHRGIATRMATLLIEIARRAGVSCVTAQTLASIGASQTILRKLEFAHERTFEHPEDGTLWEWRLQVAN